MKIKELYQSRQPVISFELFPPKPNSGLETIYDTLAELENVKPDFISVTYGAAGSLTHNKTLEIATLIKKKYQIESLHHLTCVANTENEIEQLLLAMRDDKVENILALRGDLPADKRQCSCDFRHAKDLIKKIKEANHFSVGAACYPEGHIDQLDSQENMAHLKAKANAGADFFISQLFFKNESFYRMLEQAQKAKIEVPISAGIMPILSRGQVERMIFMCGASLPSELIKLINKYEHSETDLQKAGLDYALTQMEDLVANGVDGIHVYAMNRPEVAKSAIMLLR